MANLELKVWDHYFLAQTRESAPQAYESTACSCWRKPTSSSRKKG
jgi:hypothetical protein